MPPYIQIRQTIQSDATGLQQNADSIKGDSSVFSRVQRVQPSLAQRFNYTWIHQMPLPNLKQQCTAQNRNKQRRCLNPAAFGCKTCRYHGARRQIAKGTNHPNYKHGNRSQSAIKSFSKASQELDMIEDMAESIGMVASRRRGRRSR